MALGISERLEAAKKFNLCFHCLRTGHSLSQCQSTSTCKRCNGKHHSLLHRDTQQKPPAPAAVSEKSPLSLSHHAKVSNAVGKTLLATAIVRICDAQGIPQPVRVLLDGGSDTHVISRKCTKRLGLSYKKQHTLVTGLSQTPVGMSLGNLDLDFSSQFNPSINIQAKNTCVMPTVTSDLPLHPWNPNLSHI